MRVSWHVVAKLLLVECIKWAMTDQWQRAVPPELMQRILNTEAEY